MNTAGLGATVSLMLLGLTGGSFFSWQKAKAEENKRLAEKAKKELEALKAKKLQHAQVVADFYNTYYPEMFPGKDKATAETIIKACDAVKKIASIPVTIPKFSDGNPFSDIFGI